MISTIIIVLAVIIFLAWLGVSYTNNMVRLDRLCDEAWSGIDVVLKRRRDLIPNLIECVKGYMAHEEGVLEEITRLRDNAVHAEGTLSVVTAERALVPALSGLFVRAENYPELKASANFLHLQEELVNTEDRIAAARRFYNNNVREFNVSIETFPGSLLKGRRGPRDFFEVDETGVHAPVKVIFAGQ